MLTDVYMEKEGGGRAGRQGYGSEGMEEEEIRMDCRDRRAQLVNSQQGTKHTWRGALTSLPTLDAMTPPGLYMEKYFFFFFFKFKNIKSALSSF